LPERILARNDATKSKARNQGGEGKFEKVRGDLPSGVREAKWGIFEREQHFQWGAIFRKWGNTSGKREFGRSHGRRSSHGDTFKERTA